jgi:hypothetical protein
MREAASLEVLVKLGAFPACFQGGARELTEACRAGLGAPQYNKTMRATLNISIHTILTLEGGIKQSQV